MAHILIIEGDTPEQLRINIQQGVTSNAQYYQNALLSCQANVVTQLLQPYHPDFSPKDLTFDKVDGIVFTGSTVNWSVDAPEAKPLRNTMEKVLSSGKPVLGSCNGMQLGAVVLGGKVHSSPNGLELGLAKKIQLTADGQKHRIHAGRKAEFSCPCIHRDEVSELPNGALLTATNTHSPVQAFTYEKNGVSFWGMQYHPEISATEIADIVEADGLFASGASLARDLRLLETESKADASARLGVDANDLIPQTRMLELSNWLALIAQR